MTEMIVVHGRPGRVDDYGRPMPAGPDRSLEVKTVQPLSLEELDSIDRDGVVDALRVWAATGAEVAEGDEVTIRGVRYRVEKTAWDWGHNRIRRPAVARHRPGVVFDCVRGAG